MIIMIILYFLSFEYLRFQGVLSYGMKFPLHFRVTSHDSLSLMHVTCIEYHTCHAYPVNIVYLVESPSIKKVVSNL